MLGSMEQASERCWHHSRERREEKALFCSPIFLLREGVSAARQTEKREERRGWMHRCTQPTNVEPSRRSSIRACAVAIPICDGAHSHLLLHSLHLQHKAAAAWREGAIGAKKDPSSLPPLAPPPPTMKGLAGIRRRRLRRKGKNPTWNHPSFHGGNRFLAALLRKRLALV